MSGYGAKLLPRGARRGVSRKVYGPEHSRSGDEDAPRGRPTELFGVLRAGETETRERRPATCRSAGWVRSVEK
eukprot:4563908-Prymnesium_polylepis.1